MANTKTKTRGHRRDRRKAKQSKWRRGLKRKMNGATTHGETGSQRTQK